MTARERRTYRWSLRVLAYGLVLMAAILVIFGPHDMGYGFQPM